MMVGSGSPDARQWKKTSEFSWTSLSFGPSTIRGFSATPAAAAFVNYFCLLLLFYFFTYVDSQLISTVLNDSENLVIS